MGGMSYQSSGVDYGPLDAFKRACQRYAASTAKLLGAHNLNEVSGSRGDSAYLIETPEEFLAHVEEGLGTKNLVADAIWRQTGQSFYSNIGIDLVATIVNDLVTSGALPIAAAMHAAVGDAAWFSQGTRAEDLARGFARGCELAQCVWGGGETPALPGVVRDEAIVLAGSAVGRIRPKNLLIAGDLADGDAIVLVASSGVQTNGLTLCRAIASHLKDGYASRMDDGRPFGEALLDASQIYVPLIAACQKAGVHLKYAVHITGHGWRKLMRLPEPFVYEMTDVGKVPEVFRFIQKAGPVELKEAYATFNMGAGFAIYIDPKSIAGVLSAAANCGMTAWLGGAVRKRGFRKAVEIKPPGIVFEAESLQVR
jgi:phosphoribosylformylglycinamidine cyclo-ligase